MGSITMEVAAALGSRCARRPVRSCIRRNADSTSVSTISMRQVVQAAECSPHPPGINGIETDVVTGIGPKLGDALDNTPPTLAVVNTFQQPDITTSNILMVRVFRIERQPIRRGYIKASGLPTIATLPRVEHKSGRRPAIDKPS